MLEEKGSDKVERLISDNTSKIQQISNATSPRASEETMQFGPSRNNSTSGVNVTAMNVTNTNVSADRMLPARNDERKASNAPAVTRLKPDPKVNVSVDIGEPTELYPAYRALLSGSIWCSRLLAIFSCTFQLILPVIVGLLVGNLVIRFKDGESADKT